MLCDDGIDSQPSIIGDSILDHTLNQGHETDLRQIDLLRSEPLSSGLTKPKKKLKGKPGSKRSELTIYDRDFSPTLGHDHFKNSSDASSCQKQELLVREDLLYKPTL